MENQSEINVSINSNKEAINKALKMRRVSFIINLSVTFISIIGVLSLMIFDSFLDNILEGTKKIIFYVIIALGLIFWLAFVLIDRLVKLSYREELFLAVNGTKKEYLYYEEFPEAKINETTEDDEQANLNESSTEEAETIENLSEETNTIEETQKDKEDKKTFIHVFLFTLFSNIGDIYSVICAAFFIVAIIFCFFLFPATVVGQCMEPLLYEESYSNEADKILAYKNSKFEVGDVVVFAYDYDIQDNETSITDGELLIKRVIAGPGQTFEVKNGKVYVDGIEVTEDYVKYPYSEYINYNITTIIMNNSNKDELGYEGNNVIPEGYYVLLGDNRVVANDSHYFGLVNEDQICGVVKFYKNSSGWHKIQDN